MKNENSCLKTQTEQSAREVCHLQEELKKTKQCLSQSQNFAEEMRGTWTWCFRATSRTHVPRREDGWHEKLLWSFPCILPERCPQSMWRKFSLLCSFQSESWTFVFYCNTLSPQMPGFQHFETRRVNIFHNLVNCQCCLSPQSAILYVSSVLVTSRQLSSSLVTIPL